MFTVNRFDYRCSEKEEATLFDSEAAEYLKGTLDKFRTHGIDLMPLKVQSDGSSLPHAISKGLVGFELYYDCFRADLQRELRNHEEWYRRILPLGRLLTTDVAWNAKWSEIVEAAAPTRGRRVLSENSLDGIHILAIANILRRPVLLLDTPEMMARITASEINNCGMYLPLRHPRESVLSGFNRCVGPLVIGWQSPSHSHLVALVQKRMSMKSTIMYLMANPEMDSHWKEADRLLNGLPDMAHCVVMGFLSKNHPNARARASGVLQIILRNVQKYIDNPRENSRFNSIKVENKAMKFRIMNVNYAMDILVQLGFRPQTPDGVPTLVFPLDNAVMAPQIEIVLNVLGLFTASGVHSDLVYPGMSEISVEIVPLLFGACPLVPADVTTDPENPRAVAWEIATQIYGDGAEEVGEAWCLSVGQPGDDFVRATMIQAAKTFTSLSKGTLGAWPQVITRYADMSTAAIIRCGQCNCDAAWRFDPAMGIEQFEGIAQMPEDYRLTACPGCASKGITTALSVENTFAMRVRRTVESPYASRHAAWKCTTENCFVANLRDSESCFVCRAPCPALPETTAWPTSPTTSTSASAPIMGGMKQGGGGGPSAEADGKVGGGSSPGVAAAAAAASEGGGGELGLMSGLTAALSVFGLAPAAAAPATEKEITGAAPSPASAAHDA